MKDFIEEFLYLCSANNTKSRGLYIFIAVALCLLILGAVGSAVLLAVSIAKGTFSVLYAVLLIVTVLLTVGVIVFLKKS